MTQTQNKIDRTRFGLHLKHCRIQESLSIPMLAEMASVNVLKITAIENGRELPTFEEFLGLCSGLKITPLTLANWDARLDISALNSSYPKLLEKLEEEKGNETN